MLCRRTWKLLADGVQLFVCFARNKADRSGATVSGQRPDFLAYMGSALVLKVSGKGSFHVC